MTLPPIRTDVSIRWQEPWTGEWLSHRELLSAIEARMALARTWRYRLARGWEIVCRRPPRATVKQLLSRYDAVVAMGETPVRL